MVPWAKSLTQVASQLIQPFLQGSLVWQTDRQTDHTIRWVTIGRIYVGGTAMWPNNNTWCVWQACINILLKNPDESWLSWQSLHTLNASLGVNCVSLCCAGIHGYTVNERLFTEPVNADVDGNSVCPACTRSRQEPTPESPGFVRYLTFIIIGVFKFWHGYL